MFAALTMKTIVTSNWRPLRRALCALLLGIAALWAMPRSARAQLYVSQPGIGPNTGIVGLYDATTGAPINANFITGLNGGIALALSGNNLFVASGNGGTVGEYNATTGAAINANLITGLYSAPCGLVLSGNNLFVSTDSSTILPPFEIGEYNATTGAPINPTFITVPTPPYHNVLALSGNTLFVVPMTFAVGKYDATTGATINANFITGFSEPPVSLALSGNTLFVSSYGTVGAYNATTGAAINANFITGIDPFALAVSGSTLFVYSLDVISNNGTVGAYNATTGAPINPNFITGLGRTVSQIFYAAERSA